jgi:hypothetical protein
MVICDPDRPPERWSIAELHHLCLLTGKEVVYEHMKDADRTCVTLITVREP